MRTESADNLRRNYEEIARRLGADDEEAAIFARPFIGADLRGRDTQGIACIPLVYPWFRDGGLEFGTPTTVVVDLPGLAIVDGAHGPGQVVAARAMDIAIEKAKSAGAACVWVRRTNDFTMASSYAMQALEHDCVGIAMSNGVPLVAPWGGRIPLFNTCPAAWAVPAGKYDPIVHDAAFSAVSHGVAVMAARDGRKLSGTPLVDENGTATDDPGPLILDPFDRNSPQLGAIQALGAKGSGWLFFVDIIAGVLSGGTTGTKIPFNPTRDQRSTVGHWLVAISLAALGDPDELKAGVDEVIELTKASAPAEGFDEVRYPGEAAGATQRERLRDGVPVREEHWEQLEAIADELGMQLMAS